MEYWTERGRERDGILDREKNTGQREIERNEIWDKERNRVLHRRDIVGY